MFIFVVPAVNGAVINNNSQNIVLNGHNFQILISKDIPKITVIKSSSNYSVSYSDILLALGGGVFTTYPLKGNWSTTLINGTNQLYGKYVEILMNKLVKISDTGSLNVTFQFLIANKTYSKIILTPAGPYNMLINSSRLNINILINETGQIPGNYIILKQQYFGFEKKLKYAYMLNGNQMWSNITGLISLARLSGSENYMSVGLFQKNSLINTYGWSNYLSAKNVQNFSTYYNFNNNILNIYFFYPNAPNIAHDPEINLPGSIFSIIHGALNQARLFLLDNIYSLITGVLIAFVIIAVGFMSIRKKD
jgi:hypothetical protein